MNKNKKISPRTIAVLTLSVLACTVNASADEQDGPGELGNYGCWIYQGTDDNMIKNYHGQVVHENFCHRIHNLVYHGVTNTGSEIVNHVSHPTDIDLKEDTDQCGVIVTEAPTRQ